MGRGEDGEEWGSWRGTSIHLNSSSTNSMLSKWPFTRAPKKNQDTSVIPVTVKRQFRSILLQLNQRRHDLFIMPGDTYAWKSIVTDLTGPLLFFSLGAGNPGKRATSIRIIAFPCNLFLACLSHRFQWEFPYATWPLHEIKDGVATLLTQERSMLDYLLHQNLELKY